MRTFGSPMELGEQKLRPDLSKGEGPDKYSRFSFVTPKGVGPSHKKSLHKYTNSHKD